MKAKPDFPNLARMAAILQGRQMAASEEDCGVRKLAALLGRSPGHVSLVLAGKRKSRSLLVAIKKIRGGLA